MLLTIHDFGLSHEFWCLHLRLAKVVVDPFQLVLEHALPAPGLAALELALNRVRRPHVVLLAEFVLDGFANLKSR